VSRVGGGGGVMKRVCVGIMDKNNVLFDYIHGFWPLTGPTQVSVNLYLRSISKIDDYEMVSV